MQQTSSSTVQSNSSNNLSAVVDHSAISLSAMVQVCGAFLLGLVMLYGVGFAPMSVAHNAAHDTRHAVAFPCH